MKQNEVVVFSIEQVRQLVTETTEKVVMEMLKNAHKLNDDILLNVKETCEFMHISRCTLNKWTKDNILPHIRKGGRIFYKKSDIMERKGAQFTKV